METKLCVWCNEEKPLDEMSKNVRKKDGYENRCKECYKMYQRLRKHGQIYEYAEEDNYGARVKQLNERRIVEEILVSMGYELNGDKPVYQQFLERHNFFER